MWIRGTPDKIWTFYGSCIFHELYFPAQTDWASFFVCGFCFVWAANATVRNSEITASCHSDTVFLQEWKLAAAQLWENRWSCKLWSDYSLHIYDCQGVGGGGDRAVTSFVHWWQWSLCHNHPNFQILMVQPGEGLNICQLLVAGKSKILVSYCARKVWIFVIYCSGKVWIFLLLFFKESLNICHFQWVEMLSNLQKFWIFVICCTRIVWAFVIRCAQKIWTFVTCWTRKFRVFIICYV